MPVGDPTNYFAYATGYCSKHGVYLYSGAVCNSCQQENVYTYTFSQPVVGTDEAVRAMIRAYTEIISEQRRELDRLTEELSKLREERV